MTDPVRTTMVLLEHTLPDGSAHCDWLIERPDDPREHRMLSFRCETDPLTDPGWTGERMPDHRAHYLRYEGPVSGGRGVVRRIWSHPCRVLIDHPERVLLEVSSTGAAGPARLALEPMPGSPDRWRREIGGP